MTKWAPERQRKLERLASLEWSAQEIADEFGDVTRNAVIGRCHRTGVQLANNSVRQISKETRLRGTAKRSETVRSTPEYPCGHPRAPGNNQKVGETQNGFVMTRCRICYLAAINKRARKRRAA